MLMTAAVSLVRDVLRDRRVCTGGDSPDARVAPHKKLWLRFSCSSSVVRVPGVGNAFERVSPDYLFSTLRIMPGLFGYKQVSPSILTS